MLMMKNIKHDRFVHVYIGYRKCKRQNEIESSLVYTFKNVKNIFTFYRHNNITTDIHNVIIVTIE